MPAEQPVQHLYRVRTAQGHATTGTEAGIMATSPEEAIEFRQRAIIEALQRRVNALTISAAHNTPICPTCGATGAALSDLYPEADP
jgi:hypothetical protein